MEVGKFVCGDGALAHGDALSAGVVVLGDPVLPHAGCSFPFFVLWDLSHMAALVSPIHWYFKACLVARLPECLAELINAHPCCVFQGNG